MTTSKLSRSDKEVLFKRHELVPPILHTSLSNEVLSEVKKAGSTGKTEKVNLK